MGLLEINIAHDIGSKQTYMGFRNGLEELVRIGSSGWKDWITPTYLILAQRISESHYSEDSALYLIR